MNSSKPINPMDLLYTNSFVATNEIEYSKNKDSRDRINVLKTIDRPFPKRLNRNWEPVISTEVRDIVKDRYSKRKITTIAIDSLDRNQDEFPYPNNYKVLLGRQFNYLESIKLTSVDLNSIFITNTKITWSFAFSNTQSVEIPCGEYTTEELSEVMMDCMNSLKNPNTNLANNFYIKINDKTKEIKILSRMNSPNIIAVQTILNNQDDIFRDFSSAPPTNYDANSVYVIVNHTSEFVDMINPIIPTEFPNNVGGLVGKLFNCNEFYLNPTDIKNSYEFVDSIIINSINYLRYKLTPITIENENIEASYSENLILGQGIEDIINGTVGNFMGVYNFQNTKIGVGQSYGIDFSGSNLLEDVLCWTECEINYGYIQTNKSVNNISNCKCFNTSYSGKIYNNPYIYLRIIMPSKAEDTLGNNLVVTQFNNLIKEGDIKECEDSKFGCEKRSLSNLFGKISLKDNKWKNIKSSLLQFNDKPLEKLDELIIQFIDKKGCLIDLKCDNCLTLEITEIVDVLKDTLIDSRHGESTITGYRKIS